MEVNYQSWRIIRDGAPLLLPSWAIPIYFGTHLDEKLAPEKKK
jgi:hypothetical protein